MPLKMRTVVRDAVFEADAVDICGSIKKADDFLEAAELVLARDPGCGHHLDGSHVWFISAYTLPLVVYYTFDKERVFLISIQETEILET